MAQLHDYVGQWNGAGNLVGSGARPQRFSCRLSINPGNQQRINYGGRCTTVGATLSVSGVITYNEAHKRYEAVMQSNAGYRGTAIGQLYANAIVFDLQEQQRDRSGQDMRIGATIVLADNAIVADFEVEFNQSGKVMTAKVPFRR